MKELKQLFKDKGIRLRPAGKWEFDSNKKKKALEANRSDIALWSDHADDNMAKYRPENSGHYVIDMDDIDRCEAIIPHELFEKMMATFRYRTTARSKQHCVFRYAGERKKLLRYANHHVCMDLLGYGIVFTGHLVDHPRTKFKVFEAEVLDITDAEINTLEAVWLKELELVAPDKFASGVSWDRVYVDGDKEASGTGMTFREIASGNIAVGTRCDCPFGAVHSDGIGKGYGFITDDYGVGCNSCQQIAYTDLLNGEVLEDNNEADEVESAIPKTKKTEDTIFVIDSVYDITKINAYMSNTGWNASKNVFTWVSSSGILRTFRKEDAGAFFKDIQAEDEEPNIEEVRSLLEASADMSERMVMEKYSKMVHSQMLNWIKFHHQFESIRHTVDPFSDNCVYFADGKMVINTNKVLPRKAKAVEDSKVMSDYKEHFPDLDRILDLMLAARFGADRKECYLWMHAVSNWGKSFFFAGVLKELGIITLLKEKELKKALSGDPVGIEAGDFVGAWITLFEEFRGAVAELKDITHAITFAPKGKPRIEVDVYLKVFLSAENVNSLVGDSGAEKQFTNRFMKMELAGELTKRELYQRNMMHYYNTVLSYVYQYLVKGVKHFIAIGKAEASIEANNILQNIRADIKLDVKDIMDTVAEDRETFYKSVVDILKGKQNIDCPRGFEEQVKDCFKYHNHTLYITKLGRVKELFTRSYYSENDKSKLNHKSSFEIMGILGQGKTSFYEENTKINCYKVITPE